MVRMVALVVAIAALGCGKDQPSEKTDPYARPPEPPGRSDAAPSVVEEPDFDEGAKFDRAAMETCVRLSKDAECAKARESATSTLEELSGVEHFNLGNIYYTGMGGDKEPLSARDHYQQACDQGHGLSCTLLGAMYERGEAGAPPNKAAASDFFAKGCDVGDGQGCFLRARGLETGEAGTTKPEQARALYQKACNAAVSEGCNNYASMLREGEGGDADPEQARVQFKRGCDGGFGLACANLGAMMIRGNGGDKDIAGGQTLMAKACKLGNAEACKYAPKDAGPAAP